MAALSKVNGLKLFTRSVSQLRPVVAGSRFFNTNFARGHCQSKENRSINRADPPASKSFLDILLDRCSTTKTTPKAPPSSTKVIKPWITEEGPECLDLGIVLLGVREECVKVSVDNNTVVVEGQGDKDFLEERGFEKYVCSIDLSDKLYKVSDIKAHMIKNTGLLQLAIPKLKPEDVTFDVKVDVLMSS
ncbi:mitochondrion heat shock 22 kDa protein [Artemisia annua]|uniref:Mitochondrion heat shock 22 kDa protein n=1 Tax=Artemisia annua TaxID=35608 RepID=A0A2U1KXI0_ARTAN|nr:mitochondrion heat shock 22 kDa protein [Artemisia annua]